MVLENLKYNPWGCSICFLHSNPMPQVTPNGVSHAESGVAEFSKTIFA